MFKRLNPLTLLAVFAVLLIAVILILRMDARKQQGSFLKQLVDADKNKVTSIVVIPKGKTGDAITLEKKDDHWFVSSQGKTYQANLELIERIFQAITPMTPEQLAARNKENWAEFEVTDEQGTHVKIYYGSRLSHEFVFGKIHFEQQMVQGRQSPKLNTYVRLTSGDDVYAVHGFLGSAFPPLARHYRDQTVIKLNKDDVTDINVMGPAEYSYELTKSGEVWQLNNLPVHDGSITHLLNALTWVTSQDYVEDEAEGWITIPSHQMTVKRKGAPAIEIKAYPADTTFRYFITSSQNKGAVFNGAQNDLFESIFHPAEFFFATGEPGEAHEN